MIIRPSTALRNDFPEILSLCETTNEPVFITVNGVGKLVVSTIDHYERQKEQYELKLKLLEAETDGVDDDSTYTAYEVKKYAREMLKRKNAKSKKV